MLSLIGLSFHRAHLLSALLCLEGMMLSIFIGLSLWALKFTLIAPLMYPIVMLTMSACEAGLGLSLMIATARSHGSDNLNTLNLLQC
uniref:NADH-ubiquinone oxidoreductase chain 4L n=1 Tax=Rhinella marina TaxID=8386 RepID=A0A8K1M8S8_RHIMB|nr:NADH dehydrogenase subunit 4L [Rhinella marina]UBQ34082.1 NADH dehydrogenase subunit 4L [Rhinella marina]UVN16282.1 NADH dehydrogenase subunit 4L [Rhinella marina]